MFIITQRLESRYVFISEDTTPTTTVVTRTTRGTTTGSTEIAMDTAVTKATETIVAAGGGVTRAVDIEGVTTEMLKELWS